MGIGTVVIYAHLDADGTCPGLEGGHQIVKWLASGGIDVGLLFTAAQNAPLWAFNHSLVDWPFIVCDLVASGRLLPHTLRQVLDALNAPPQATALFLTQPNKHLVQRWGEIHGLCPILSLMQNFVELDQQTPEGRMQHMPWSGLPKWAAGSHRYPGLVRAGVVMKSERQQELSSREMLPLTPTDGVVFIPLDVHQPLAGQQPYDALLHKATDLPETGPGLTWSNLEHWVDAHPEVLLVDPLWAVRQVMSRGFNMYLSEQAERMNMPFAFPAALMVERLDDATALALAMQSHGLRMPCILKPLLACGPKWAHDLAVVFDIQGLCSAKVRTPALLQEYIDHSSTLHKVYVAGTQVGVSTHGSLPDAAMMQHGPSSVNHQTMTFNSLEQTPYQDISLDFADTGGCHAGLPMHTVHQAADFLRSATHLSLFGFDMVVRNGTGRIYIVDVNYFPSYRVASSYQWLTSLLKARVHQHHHQGGNSLATGPPPPQQARISGLHLQPATAS